MTLGRRVLPALVLLAVAACSVQTAPESDTARVTTTNFDPFQQVRVETTDARVLVDAGFDVLEGSETATTVDVIGSPEEIARLRSLGYSPVLIAEGGPLDAVEIGDTLYPPFDDMLAQMRAMEAAHPTIAKVVDLTDKLGAPPTAEGRHLFALKISDNVADEEDEPTYLLVSNHHARELGTPLATMNAMKQLTSSYATDDRIKHVVDSNEIWIAPTWNPDGLNYVHTTEKMWRKNRRPNGSGKFGVDQNRNYPFLWNTSCGNSTSPSSDTYKGPTAASEPETQTMTAFYQSRHFAKVLDIHSSGREVLAGYSCASFVLEAYYKSVGAELSRKMGYNGATRKPSAHGEHGDYAIGNFSSLFFLVEINTTFQPPVASAQAEAEQIWPGILWHMERPVPLSGHVKDAATGAPLDAKVTVRPVAYTQGEVNSSGGKFGRWQAFLPPGAYEVEFAAPGYATQRKAVEVSDATEQVLDVALAP